MGGKRQVYSEFVEKFKPKHTTDDCYTPDNIYSVVSDYVRNRYGADPANFVRPFWPGGDYERADYPDGCVVVDNPPFSIISKIVRFYTSHGVKFFLFASGLVAANSSQSRAAIISLGVSITYANGAKVSTSFLTNLEPFCLRSDPELYRALRAADETNTQTRTLPRYVYPPEVATCTDFMYMSKNGVSFTVPGDELRYIPGLDSQKQKKKQLFGGGFLISEKAAAEKTEAMNKAAKNSAAMDKTAGKGSAIVWTLSDVEKDIIRSLTGGKNAS